MPCSRPNGPISHGPWWPGVCHDPVPAGFPSKRQIRALIPHLAGVSCSPRNAPVPFALGCLWEAPEGPSKRLHSQSCLEINYDPGQATCSLWAWVSSRKWRCEVCFLGSRTFPLESLTLLNLSGSSLCVLWFYLKVVFFFFKGWYIWMESKTHRNLRTVRGGLSGRLVQGQNTCTVTLVPSAGESCGSSYCSFVMYELGSSPCTASLVGFALSSCSLLISHGLSAYPWLCLKASSQLPTRYHGCGLSMLPNSTFVIEEFDVKTHLFSHRDAWISLWSPKDLR